MRNRFNQFLPSFVVIWFSSQQDTDSDSPSFLLNVFQDVAILLTAIFGHMQQCVCPLSRASVS